MTIRTVGTVSGAAGGGGKLLGDIEANAARGKWFASDVDTYRSACAAAGRAPDEGRIAAARTTWAQTVFADKLADVEKNAARGKWFDSEIETYKEAAKELGQTPDTQRIADAKDTWATAVVDHKLDEMDAAAARGKLYASDESTYRDACKHLGAPVDEPRLKAIRARANNVLLGDDDGPSQPTPNLGRAARNVTGATTTPTTTRTQTTQSITPPSSRATTTNAPTNAPTTNSTAATATQATTQTAAPEKTKLTPAQEQALSSLPKLAQQMIQLSPPGDEHDLALMARSLGALDPSMLKALADSGYTLHVTRYRLSNAKDDLKDVTVTGGGSGAFLADLAEGVHMTRPGEKPSIVVRTYLQDGVLRIDASTLIHEIGHAFDLVVGVPTPSNALNVRTGRAQVGGKDPIHLDKDMADAFAKEHQRLPQYFHTQPEFFAESFALYMLDPVRCKRQLPLAFACLEKRFAAIAPEKGKLLEVEKDFDRPAVVTTSGQDLRKQLALVAQQSRVLRQAGLPASAVVVHLQAKADWGAEAYVRDAAREVRNSHGNDAGVYRSQESFVKLSPATFNDAAQVEKILTDIETSGRAAVLFVEDAGAINKGSAGFAVIEDFIAKHRDVPPLVIAGEPTALAALNGAMPTVMTLPSKLEALDAAQQVELVKRNAAQDGYLLDKGVDAALEKKLKGGGYALADEAWRGLKAAQFERNLKDGSVKGIDELKRITVDDVAGMKLQAKKTPQERLDAMIGQQLAKDQIASITGQARVTALREAQGLAQTDPLRINLLFAGAPGTGKTTFAEILGALLQETGFIKNPTVTKVTIQDLVAGKPEVAVKNLFEANRGGVIFIDEMHQLKDTAEGRAAFRALIPYMTDASFKDTVFIGAGYSDELGDLIKNVDPGAERRFTTVPFIDYKRDELATILDGKAKDLQLVLDKPTREAALAFLDYRKRVTKNFGNAGEIDVAMAHAQKAQTLRLTQMDPKKVTAKELVTLVKDDFAVPKPITKAEFWAEMDAMSGWADVKADLKKMAASIEGAEKRGKAPADVVEPYWVVDGPPGTGKSTLARLLAKFGAAYGLTAVPEVVESQGAAFQGEFVGQTAGVVVKQFEKAWGRLMFVDEVSGLAKSGGTFKDEAAKTILAQMENHRGKFMMVVADYAENINQFLKLDPGLPRRFGNRITLQPWTADEATVDLLKKMGEEGIDVKGAEAQLKKKFAELAKTPGYASGGDVRSIKNLIIGAIDAAPAGTSTAKILTKAVDEAFKTLIDKKLKDAGPASENPLDGAPVATAVAVATAQATETKPKPNAYGLTAADKKIIAAMDAVSQKLAAQLNGLTPAALEKILNDPKSDYGKQLGLELGVKPEEAVKAAQTVRVKVKKLVQKQEIVKRFVYHCPFCGGIDSPSCGFIRQPIEWKIQHSLKKPWDEVKTSTVEVDVIEERKLES